MRRSPTCRTSLICPTRTPKRGIVYPQPLRSMTILILTRWPPKKQSSSTQSDYGVESPSHRSQFVNWQGSIRDDDQCPLWVQKSTSTSCRLVRFVPEDLSAEVETWRSVSVVSDQRPMWLASGSANLPREASDIGSTFLVRCNLRGTVSAGNSYVIPRGPYHDQVHHS